MAKKMKTRKVILENCNVLPIHWQMGNYLTEIQIQNFHRSGMHLKTLNYQTSVY